MKHDYDETTTAGSDMALLESVKGLEEAVSFLNAALHDDSPEVTPEDKPQKIYRNRFELARNRIIEAITKINRITEEIKNI